MSWKTSLGCSHSNAFPLRQNRFVDYPQRRNCAPRSRKSPSNIVHRSATFLLPGNVRYGSCASNFVSEIWVSVMENWKAESFHRIIFMNSTWEYSLAANQIHVQVETFPFAASFNYEWNEVEFKRHLMYAFLSYLNWIKEELLFYFSLLFQCGS